MARGLIEMIMANKKFSMVAFPTAFGTTWFAYDYSLTRDLMTAMSRKASLHGDKRLGDGKARHITVILNPVAGKRKSKKLYAKWVEPLLHLAGIKVSVVETESRKQIFDLMKIMSNCDGVAIVGGDGTVHEAINGLLHRPDCAKAVQNIPIAIIPVGQVNSIARYIYQGHTDYRNQKQFLIQATMKLVDGCSETFDVLKIDSLASDDAVDAEEKSSVYALRDVRYGKFQNSYVNVAGFLTYQTYFKPYWHRLKSIFSSKFVLPQIESISYTNPCIGCTKCHERHKLKSSQPDVEISAPSVNRRWWSVLAPVRKQGSGPSEKALREAQLAKRENPDCGSWIEIEDVSKITELRASMMGEKIVRLSVGKNGEFTPSTVIETQDVRLKLPAEQDEQANLVKSATDKEEEDKTAKFLIDGQPKPAHSIEISTLHDAITIFSGAGRLVV